MNLYTYFKLKYLFNSNVAFVWHSNEAKLMKIKKIKSIPLNLLLSIDRQKKILQKNTINFANNNVTNNALLWGARGNGKSTLIKSMFIELITEFSNLRLIQLNKNDILEIKNIYSILLYILFPFLIKLFFVVFGCF